MDKVNERFAPLVDALRRLDIHPGSPWNTGGHVMCVPVTLPVVEVDGETHEPYLLFSDEAEVPGCGLYLGTDSQGINLTPTWWADYMQDFQYGIPPDGWRHGNLGERTAHWLATLMPALLEWYDTITWSIERQARWITFTPDYPTAPEFVDTIVTDYDS